jgi:hypothetical protein
VAPGASGLIRKWFRRQTDDPGFAVSLLGLLFGIGLFFGLMFLALHFTAFGWIGYWYGYDAYAQGLRFVDKRTLSNGDVVGPMQQLIILLPAFLVAAPVTFIYMSRYRRWVNRSYDRYDRA